MKGVGYNNDPKVSRVLECPACRRVVDVQVDGRWRAIAAEYCPNRCGALAIWRDTVWRGSVKGKVVVVDERQEE